MKPAELFHASSIMALGTIFSRITGFIRSVLAVAVLGTALLADTYNVANTLPYILSPQDLSPQLVQFCFSLSQLEFFSHPLWFASMRQSSLHKGSRRNLDWQLLLLATVCLKFSSWGYLLCWAKLQTLEVPLLH